MEKTTQVVRVPDGATLERIVRDLGNFTVALFGVDRIAGHFCGSGTLVSVANCHCILTAAHVWQYLKLYPGIQITVKEKVDHSFRIARDTIVPTGTIEPDEGWGEWGPDLCFLLLPPHRASSIEAYKIFYNLDKRREQVGDYQWWALMGTPESEGIFTDRYADFRITGSFLGVIGQHDKDGLDYLDIGVDLSLPGAPPSFSGVSGGGLWRITFTESSSGLWTWDYVLKGVAFYQSPVIEGHRFVRCHGPKSIQNLIPVVPTGQTG